MADAWVEVTDPLDPYQRRLKLLDNGDDTYSVAAGLVSGKAIDNGNSTSVALSGGGIFTGAAVEVSNYVEVIVSIYSDVAGAPDGVLLEGSNDLVNWYEIDTFEYHAVGVMKQWKTQLPLRYFRVEYENGASDQTVFLLTCKLQKVGGVSRSHTMESAIDGHDDADLVKAGLIAVRRGSDGDAYQPIEADVLGNLYTTIGGITQDAGARVRVSQLNTLGDYKELNYAHSLLWEQDGTGTIAWATNKVNLSVTSGQWIVRQSHRHHQYFSGKSQAVECTFDGFAPQTNVIKRFGYFSSNFVSPFDSNYDGFWVESSGGSISLKCSRDGTATLSIDITAWSGYDALLEYQNVSTWDNFTVCFFDFLWLGGAVLRLWVKTSAGFILAHVFHYSGTAKDVFILSPNQPVRYEIRSTTGTGSFRYICAQVSTEGSIDESGLSRGVNTGTTAMVLGSVGVKYPVKAIRRASAAHDAVIRLEDISINIASNDRALYTVEINPTLSAALTYAAVANSSFEQASGNGTITVTAAGTIIANGYVSSGSPISSTPMINNFLAKLGGTLTGVEDQYVLCITPITSNLSAFAAMNVKEYS